MRRALSYIGSVVLTAFFFGALFALCAILWIEGPS